MSVFYRATINANNWKRETVFAMDKLFIIYEVGKSWPAIMSHKSMQYQLAFAHVCLAKTERQIDSKWVTFAKVYNNIMIYFPAIIAVTVRQNGFIAQPLHCLHLPLAKYVAKRQSLCHQPPTMSLWCVANKYVHCLPLCFWEMKTGLVSLQS